MTSFIENINLALPEIVVLATGCIAILAELFLSKYYKSITCVCAITGLIVAGIISFLFLGHYSELLFSGNYISDDIGHLMKLFIYLTVILSFFYSQHYIEEHKIPRGEFYILGLFSTLGMMVLVSAHSLLIIYLGLELLSLPLYAMTAIRRSYNDSSEAALKYFVMGALASGMLLYGISLLYGATGKIDLHEIAIAAAASHDQTNLLNFAMVFIIAGVGFKLAAMPFHMWAPDVYQGAPTPVTLFLSTAPKIAAVAMALRILMIALPDYAAQWQQLILVMALLSTGLGNLLAIVQSNIKRLLAYSAISHMGYALFGILAGTSSGYAASLYYVVVYALMSAGAFGLIVVMSRTGLDIEEVSDLKGLNRRNPWLAFMMLIIMFSMAGVPPTVGFFTKLLVLKALVDVHMTWVAVLGLLFAVIGAFYYLSIIKVMYFDDVAESAPVKLPAATNIIISLNCLALLYLGIFPTVLITACINAIK